MSLSAPSSSSSLSSQGCLVHPSRHVHVNRPRPDRQRAANEYVELRGRSSNARSNSRQPIKLDGRVITSQPVSQRIRAAPPPVPPPLPIRTEAKPRDSKKSRTNAPGRPAAGGSHICRECGRCKCASCTERAKADLSGVGCWMGECRCTPQSCIDAVTCACLVQAAYYHCVQQDRQDSLPASSSSGEGLWSTPAPLDPEVQSPCRCARNWGLLGLASLLLPCLCCYPPLMCLKAAVGACYARIGNRRGCRCRPPASPSSNLSNSTVRSTREKSAPPRMLNGYDNLGKLLHEDPL